MVLLLHSSNMRSYYDKHNYYLFNHNRYVLSYVYNGATDLRCRSTQASKRPLCHLPFFVYNIKNQTKIPKKLLLFLRLHEKISHNRINITSNNTVLDHIIGHTSFNFMFNNFSCSTLFLL